jgi:hypothetical protein
MMAVVGGTFSEFLEVVRKNFGASDVRILSDGEAPPPSQGVLVCELPLGQLLAVSFTVPPADPHSAQRRLEMLVRAFESTLSASPETAGSAPKARALHDELAALVERAGALDALVIDAHSPAIWGGAYAELPEVLELYDPPREPDNVVRIDGQPTVNRATETSARGHALGLRVFEALALDPRAMALVPREACERHSMVPLFGSGSALLLAMVEPTNLAAIYEASLASGLDVEPALAPERLIRFILAWNYGGSKSIPPPAPPSELDDEERAAREAVAQAARNRWMRHFATRKAIQLVRAMPELGNLHRGGHLNRTVTEQDFACIARSFAGIYVLVVVFEGPFDEIRAKHAVSQALPIIESLVLALPPRDPPPSIVGARAARRPIRR